VTEEAKPAIISEKNPNTVKAPVTKAPTIAGKFTTKPAVKQPGGKITTTTTKAPSKKIYFFQL